LVILLSQKERRTSRKKFLSECVCVCVCVRERERERETEREREREREKERRVGPCLRAYVRFHISTKLRI